MKKRQKIMLKYLISTNYPIQRPFYMLTKDNPMRYMLNMYNSAQLILHICVIFRTFVSTNKYIV